MGWLDTFTHKFEVCVEAINVNGRVREIAALIFADRLNK